MKFKKGDRVFVNDSSRTVTGIVKEVNFDFIEVEYPAESNILRVGTFSSNNIKKVKQNANKPYGMFRY